MSREELAVGVLGAGRRFINRLVKPLGIEVQVLDSPRRASYDLTDYEEVERPASPLYVNIGAGGFFHPYWHNLDSPNEYYREAQGDHLHVQHDLTSGEPLPFADDSVKVFYASHVIEHISNEDASLLFAEVHRCLRPGGYFRVTCPDMDLEYAAYTRGDLGFWKWPNAYGVYNASIGQRFLDHFATALTETHPSTDCPKLTDDEVARIFSAHPKEEAFDLIDGRVPKEIQREHFGDHINWFNAEKIMRMLRAAGFSDVYESRYAQSCCPVLRDTRLFDTTCPELSVYVECRK